MSVGQICVRHVDTALPNEDVYVAAERMLQRAVGTLVIVNTEEQPIGIVTDRDLVERVLAKGRNPNETMLCAIMTPSPKAVSDETSIEYALALMRSGRFRRLPVVDQQQRLIGLISLDDILMSLGNEFIQVGRLLAQETPRCIITS